MNTPFSKLLQLADPVDRAILTGLSNQLKLSGDDRIQTAQEMSRSRRSRRSRNARSRESNAQANSNSQAAERLRREIAADLKKRWPELANVMNPKSIELITAQADEFVNAVQSHDQYDEYRELKEDSKRDLNAAEKRVKFERLVRIAENVVLATNLQKIGSDADKRNFQRILASESSGLGND